MTPEDILQHKVVMNFSQCYPQHYGCLWAVFNEDSKHKKALGMHSGASDLQFFIFGIFGGIELKAPGSTHKTSHIKQQIEWGENLVKNGGYYLMSSNYNLINEFIESAIKNDHHTLTQISDYSIKKVKGQFNNKTIKF